MKEKTIKKRIKANLCITLTALAVTVIVLIILTAVSLSIVLGKHSIFGKAENGAAFTEIVRFREPS